MRTPDEIVRAEVLCCMSGLVAALANGDGQVTRRDSFDNPVANDLADLCERAFELAAPIDDWEEAAIQAGGERYTTPNGGAFWRMAGSNETAGDANLTFAEAFCLAYDIDPYQREVFEHWAVTEWLADALEAEGEKVDRDFAGLCVWARATTGQMISADGVIERVAAAAERRYREAVAAIPDRAARSPRAARPAARPLGPETLKGPNQMHIVFDVTPARKTKYGYQISFSMANGPHPMRRVVEVPNLKALLPLFDSFKAEADATGQPLYVDFRQHPQDRSRKFPGFDKAAKAGHYTPATATATATEDDLHAMTRYERA